MSITFEALAALLHAPESATLEVETGAGIVLLSLTEATAHPGDQPGGSLLFTGSADVPLGQDTFTVTAGDLNGELFLVPVAERDGLRTYQAVFA